MAGPKGESCKTCYFFEAHSRAQEEKMHRGRCFAQPPRLNGVTSSASQFPTVSSDEWCGHFKLQVEVEVKSQG